MNLKDVATLYEDARAKDTGGQQWFEWLRLESERLISEGSDPEHGICGNEWLIVEYLKEAEQAGVESQFLDALQNCVCEPISALATSMLKAA